jgi:hypothetical protein
MKVNLEVLSGQTAEATVKEGELWQFIRMLL